MIRAIFIILSLASFEATSQTQIEWGNVASIDAQQLTIKAESYLAENAKELEGLDLKVLEVSASFRNGGKSLFASFFHNKSYVEGSEEVLRVQTEDGEIDHQFITFDIVVVEFDDMGNPHSHRILGKKYPGTVQDFKKEFSEQHGEH